jgi:hypothetical protein
MPHHMPAALSLDLSTLHVGSVPSTLFTISLPFFSTSKSAPFQGHPELLVSYWFARWSCESPAVSSCPMASHWELRSTLQFPSCSIYNLKFLASRLLSLQPAFMLVSCSACLTLKVEAMCSSEMSVDFQQDTKYYLLLLIYWVII